MIWVVPFNWQPRILRGYVLIFETNWGRRSFHRICPANLTSVGHMTSRKSKYFSQIYESDFDFAPLSLKITNTCVPSEAIFVSPVKWSHLKPPSLLYVGLSKLNKICLLIKYSMIKVMINWFNYIAARARHSLDRFVSPADWNLFIRTSIYRKKIT